jgi:hypothetical protein
MGWFSARIFQPGDLVWVRGRYGRVTFCLPGGKVRVKHGLGRGRPHTYDKAEVKHAHDEIIVALVGLLAMVAADWLGLSKVIVKTMEIASGSQSGWVSVSAEIIAFLAGCAIAIFAEHRVKNHYRHKAIASIGAK